MKNLPAQILALAVIVFVDTGWSAIPPEINIQGTLEAPEEGTLIGDRDYRIRFLSSDSGGLVLGEVSGTVTLSASGRFSIDLLPTPAVLDAAEVWYELAIDSSGDGIDPNDVFPDPVRVQSVPFALRAGDAQTLDGLSPDDYVTPSSLPTHAWTLEGNAGTTGGTDFLGTTDVQPLELRVNGSRALGLIPNAGSPNLIGGFNGNEISSGVMGGTIGGGGVAGEINSVTSDFGTVAGGRANKAAGSDSTVGGGRNNEVLALLGTIAGGGADEAEDGNRVTDRYGFVGGGFANKAGNDSESDVDAWLSAVVGGADNTASGGWSFVGGGLINHATADESTIAGGNRNRATSSGTFVGGGYNNQASGSRAVVVGGHSNTASGYRTSIGGGEDNSATGEFSVVPGGDSNEAIGDYSFAAGRHAKAVHNGSFVWADTQDADFESTAEDQFAVRADGGVRLRTNEISVGPAESYVWISGNGVRKFHESDSTVIDMDTTGGAVITRGSGEGERNVMLPITIMGPIYGQDVRVTDLTIWWRGETAEEVIQVILLRRQKAACEWDGCYERLLRETEVPDCNGMNAPSGCKHEFPVTENNVLTEDSGILYLTLELNFSSNTRKIWIGGVRLTLEHD